MRATPSAVYFARDGRQATMDAARNIAALTHGDPAAWEGSAIFHDLIRVALDGANPLDHISQTLAAVHPGRRERYAAILAPGWHPDQATNSTAPCGPVSAQPSGLCAPPAAMRRRSAPRSTWAATPIPSPRSPAAWPEPCTDRQRFNQLDRAVTRSATRKRRPTLRLPHLLDLARDLVERPSSG